MKKLKLNAETLRVLTQPAAPLHGLGGLEEAGSSRMATVCGCTEPITN